MKHLKQDHRKPSAARVDIPYKKAMSYWRNIKAMYAVSPYGRYNLHLAVTKL